MRRSALHSALKFSTIGLVVCCLNAGAATLYVDAHRPADPSINRFASLPPAVAKLEPGDTLLIANGTYRDSLDLRQSHLTPARPLSMPTLIAAAPGAHPVIKGSDVVSGWQRVDKNLYVKRPWPHNSQQVFINGKALKQIGGVIYGDYPLNAKHPFTALHRSQGGIWPGRTGDSRADLVTESFYYEIDSQALYVMTATDITRGPEVEVSTRPYLLIATGVEQLAVRGIRFEHANTTSVSQSGALTLVGNRLQLEDVIVSRVDGAGIDVTGDDNVIARSSAIYCGVVGLKVRGRRAQVIDNESNFNNTRGFNKWWEAGGAKFVGDGGLQDSEVTGHRAYGNQGDGLWFDWRNDNNRIHDNIAAYNSGMGIHYEASHRGLIYDNYVYGNAQRGIYLPNSSHSIVAHNLVVANGMEGIVVVDDRQVPADSELSPTNNIVIANVIAWNAKSALVLPTTATNNRSDANLFISADVSTYSSGWPTRTRPLASGLDAWRSLSGQDSSSRENRSAMQGDLQAQLTTRQPLSATMRRSLNALLATTSSQVVPAIDGIDTHLSRPGSKPGPGAMP